jgi:hypothetical protein
MPPGSTDYNFRIGRQMSAPILFKSLLTGGAQMINVNPVFPLFEYLPHPLQQRPKSLFADAALENAALHARAIVFHNPGDAVEPFVIGDVIGNEQKHRAVIPLLYLVEPYPINASLERADKPRLA